MSVLGWVVAAKRGVVGRRADARRHVQPMCKLVLCALGVLALGACHRGRAQAPAPAPALAAISPMARLYYDNGGGIQDSVRMVVRDAAAFARVWQRATSVQTQPPPVPSVDFEHQMVIVAGAGSMTPDDQIQIDSVGPRKESDQGRVRDVLVAFVRTTESCRKFRASAYPLEIVQVRRYDGAVRFAEQRVKPATCR